MCLNSGLLDWAAEVPLVTAYIHGSLYTALPLYMHAHLAAELN